MLSCFGASGNPHPDFNHRQIPVEAPVVTRCPNGTFIKTWELAELTANLELGPIGVTSNSFLGGVGAKCSDGTTLATLQHAYHRLPHCRDSANIAVSLSKPINNSSDVGYQSVDYRCVKSICADDSGCQFRTRLLAAAMLMLCKLLC